MGTPPKGEESGGQPEAKTVRAMQGIAPGMPAGAGPETGQDAGVVCRGLTKDFGARRVLDDVSFAAPMGTVTGFVGVNGAGKTLTLRIVLGLVAPTSGMALVAGKRYPQLDRPGHVVGAALERLGSELTVIQAPSGGSPAPSPSPSLYPPAGSRGSSGAGPPEGTNLRQDALCSRQLRPLPASSVVSIAKLPGVRAATGGLTLTDLLVSAAAALSDAGRSWGAG